MPLIKSIIPLFLALVCVVHSSTAQVTYFSEDFDAVPCPAGCSANGYPGWSTAASGANGMLANEWYVSCAENGMTAGQCGTGCAGAGNNSLHISSSPVMFGDIGAAYFSGVQLMPTGAETNTRAESPPIDLATACNVVLSFDYIEFGDFLTDNFVVEYSADGGTTWLTLADPPKTACCGGPCDGTTQGLWSAFTITLPAAAYVYNFRLGFRWQNNDDAVGSDPSVAIDNIIIEGGQGPDASFTMPSPICAGDILSINLTNIVPGVAYDGDADGIWFNPFSPGISFLDTTTLDICVTATDACGEETVCEELVVIDCNVGPFVAITASATDICVGDCISFSSAGSAPGTSQFSWNFNGATPSFSGMPNPQNICYNTAGVYDVQVTAYWSNGNIVDTTLFLYINVSECTGPDLLMTWDPGGTDVCQNTAIEFVANCATCTDVQWSFGGGSPATSTSFTETVTFSGAPGVYTVTLTGTDANGESATQSVNFTIIDCNTGPELDFTWDVDNICDGEQVTFTADCPDCILLDWNFVGGTPGASAATSPSVTYNTPGSYTVSLTGTNLMGQTTTVTYTNAITVNDCGDAPVASFTPSALTVCTGGFLTFNNTSDAAPNAQYGWLFNGGQPGFSLQQNPGQVIFNTPGTYDIVLAVSDAYGTDTVVVTITVDDCPVPVAYFTASTTNICRNESIVFTDASENAVTWSWTFQGGTPATWNDATPPAIFYTSSSATPYTVTLTVSDGMGNDSTYTMLVYVSGCGVPTPAFTVSDNNICEGGCVQFYDASIDNPTGWAWSFPGAVPPTSSQQNPPYVCYPQAGTYPVQLIAFNSFGMDTTILQSYITVNPSFTPGVSATSNDIVMGQSVSISASGGVSYNWYPLAGLTNDTLASALAAPTLTTTYTVIATNANGCTGSAQVVINVRPPDMVFVANLFTPNGDRVNDRLRLQYTGEVERAEFGVYDRWGNTVFFTNDVDQGWDGMYNGKPVNTGVYVYFYRVRFTSGYVARGKGDVTLLR